MENSADIAVLFVLLVSALWGGARGFAREVFSLAAWVGAFVLAARTAPLILPWIAQRVTDPLAATALAYIISFIVLVLVLSTVAQRFATGLRSVLVGGTDKLLGCLFGVARGYILLVVLYLVCVSMVGTVVAHSLIAGSKSGPYILDGVYFVRELMPYFPKLHLAMPPATGHEAAF
ncbi:CvpA family protein [Asaia bogorensis]|uniref:CvpA family protein n=1 Tax=Asaia bogorensis TaxID=91915 RepID=UPI000EFCE775|nr:CvpA family protein [Asaia bogorensis]